MRRSSSRRNFICRTALLVAGVLAVGAVVFNVNLLEYAAAHWDASFAVSAQQLSLPRLAIGDHTGATVALVILIVFLLFVSLFTRPRERAK